MRGYVVLLSLFFIPFLCRAQERDSLKITSESPEEEELRLNQKTWDAIKAGTLIGPEPERKRTRNVDEQELRSLAGGGLGEDLVDSLMTEDAPGLWVSDGDKKRLKGWRDIYHHKTTVDDERTLPGMHVKVSFEDFFRYLFRPTERAKIRNKKRAKAYKTYND